MIENLAPSTLLTFQSANKRSRLRSLEVAALNFPCARSVGMLALLLIQAVTITGLVGCTPTEQPAGGSGHGATTAKGKPVMLAITGYNYTRRNIGSFSVNGAWGGDIAVSTPDSGGGGTTCCVRYRPGTKIRDVMVEWQTGGCYFREVSGTSGEVFDTLHSFSYRRKVEVDPIVPLDPKVFEVHFYPDGTIKASITASESLPRLRLDQDREDKSQYPRCPNEKKPAE